jgi:hypothetical protein
LSSYSTSIRKGFLVAAILIVADFVVGLLSMFVGLPSLETIGDLLLLEAGVLAIAGGLVEFSRSKGAHEFRRVALQSKDDFSIAKHSEASKKAIVFFSAAAILFLLLVTLALLR